MLGNLRISGDIRPGPAFHHQLELEARGKDLLRLSPNSPETGKRFEKRGRWTQVHIPQSQEHLSKLDFVISFGLGDAKADSASDSEWCAY